MKPRSRLPALWAAAARLCAAVALEPRLGRAESTGCVRIPATLDEFIDCQALLEADREPLPWPGRDLVIVDSAARERPAGSPRPGARPNAVPAPAARADAEAEQAGC